MNYDPLPDVPLLRKAVEWVESQESVPIESREWWQYVYREDVRPGYTRRCVMTYVTDILLGLKPRYADCVETPEGGLAYTMQVAQAALGLTSAEAEALRYGGNSAADIRRIAEHAATRAGERL